MKINLGKVFDTGSGGREPIVEALSVTENGTYTPSTGVDGFNEVNVQVPIPTFTTEELSATANGEYVPSADGYSKVTVAVPTPEPNLQEKTTSQRITTNGTSTITVSPDSGYDGLSSANVTITTNVTASMPTLVLENVSNSTSSGFRISGDADLSNCDTSNMTSMRRMFYSYSKLASLDVRGWNTSAVTSMYQMFYRCNSLTTIYGIEIFNTSAVTDMFQMFSECGSLTSLDVSGWNTSAVTNMRSMFTGCNALTSLDVSNFNTSAVTSMYGMFNTCSSLTSLDLSNWDTSSVTDMRIMFNGCNAITNLNMTNVILPKMDLTDWSLDSCPLTVDSLVSVLNALPQLDEGQSFTCTIGSTNLAKLSDEQKAIATNKGWTIN